MNAPTLRRPLLVYLVLLLPVMGLATRFDPYIIDGDAVAYMDIADLLHAHQWASAVNGYWHPLYPALLCVGQIVGHTSRWDELGAYYVVNFLIFLAQVAAMLAFTTGLIRLRDSLVATPALLQVNAIRLLGLALLVVSAQRELSMGRVRPDGLLQALILAALAMLMFALASNRIVYVASMGVFLGLAYLTKSFALVFALLAIVTLVLFSWRVQRRPLTQSIVSGAVAFVVFAAIAGPYVAALSKQKGRFDFGDSGGLNYAWYVSGTEKMHLEPSMTKDFGSASVKLVHPEQQLMASPGVYSYKGHPLGTYPAWFDTTYFNERIVPHFNLKRLVKQDSRNVLMVLRYVLNHPEPWILLAVLLFAGASLRRGLRVSRFWWPPVALGLAMWVIYGMVNVEERYVTVAYFALLLPMFAALWPAAENGSRTTDSLRSVASALVLLVAFLALGETLREALQLRRDESVKSFAHGWDNPQIFGAAHGLLAMGVRPGDEIACVGTMACLNDLYWARLAGVQILTEVYAPDAKHLINQLGALPNREQVYDVVRGQGARVLVGSFDPGEMNAAHPASVGWVRLGETSYYALPLQLPGSDTGSKEAR